MTPNDFFMSASFGEQGAERRDFLVDKFIGKRLDGRYEIKELIGVGGMAYVYKAYDSIDDRVVAIKILREELLANEEFTRRFKNESKAIAILSHPNIVKVYDVSFGERLQYIVMEYIDGITLKEYIDQQKDIKWKEAVHFTVQILRALQHAHDKGIVHRDIKPQNIMLLSDGTIKVTDFGIARFSRTDIRATGATDKAIGSVHYISPEQARGEITDEKADIYSVGVMLYEMLTGRLPFEADNAVSVAIMQLQSEPKLPREINPQIPEGLEDITIKAMQKDPAKRYQSAAEMLYDIDEFKRNPSIHFEYTYFKDETPTRFVEAITRMKGESPAANPQPQEPVVEDEEDDEEERKGPPVLPILAAVAGAFVLVALIFVGIIVFGKILNPGDNVDEILVPNLVGKNYANEIQTNAEWSKNFKFIVENNAFHDTIPEGGVISSDPKANTKVKVGSEIRLTISKGPQTTTVPDVAGEHKDTARARLENAGFTVIPVSQPSDTVDVDFVIRTDPAGNQEYKAGSVIQMFVSIGKEEAEPVAVPNVVDTTQTEAENQLRIKGLTPVIEIVNHPSYAAGLVFKQEPAADTQLKPGEEVKIFVSSGYKDVKLTVPLPRKITDSVDLQISVDGRVDETLSSKHSGIIPADTGEVVLELNGLQKDNYRVRIKIAMTGSNNFQDYYVFDVNGKDGTSKQMEYHPFDEPDTPGTTTDVSSQPEPTDPVSNPDEGEDVSSRSRKAGKND